jgi:hypothetical protein
LLQPPAQGRRARSLGQDATKRACEGGHGVARGAGLGGSDSLASWGKAGLWRRRQRRPENR